MYINSNNIKVYPTAKRDDTSNLITEKNITDISNNITDINSYIVSGFDCEVNGDNTGFILYGGKCVVNGYYITLRGAGSDNAKPEETILDNYSFTNANYAVYLALDNYDGNVLNGVDDDNYPGTDDPMYTGAILGFGNIEESILNKPHIILAQVNNTGDGLVIIPKNKKINANLTAIELDAKSNLVKNNYKGTFEDWLLNNFILDDGEI